MNFPQQVGQIKAVYRYPVKSMRGEALPEAQIGWSGIEGDRRYGFVKNGSLSDFPWLTGREIPEMVTFAPRFVDPANWIDSKVLVILPDGREVPLDSADLLAALTRPRREPPYLMSLKRGCYDAMPLSLLSTSTIGALSVEAGLPLEARRFRPNILLELGDPLPFGEERWIGGLLQLGEGDRAPFIRVNRQNVRCAMTNIDPDTASRDPRVLKTIVQQHAECAGLYGAVQRTGRICEGDPVYLIEG